MSIRKALLALATLAFFAAGPAAAQDPQTFGMLQPPQPTEGGGKVEVVEFFWYGCPHCYALEPSVNAWIKSAPKDVVFKRVPAMSNASWTEAGKIYYTLEGMGLLEQYHQKVFDAMHKDNINLANKRLRDEWLAKNGIDPAKYNDMEKSFSVASKVSRAQQMTAAYKVDSVPRIAVNGKYYTSAEQAGGAAGVFPVVDQLVARARKDK
jgi:thiol:disulfide interchange protein DsbA